MIALETFDPKTLVLIALLNPVVIAVAFYMGRTADQWQKIPVAAFAASCAGFVLFWLATYFGLITINSSGGASGIMMLQFVFGLVWASLGYFARESQGAIGGTPYCTATGSIGAIRGASEKRRYCTLRNFKWRKTNADHEICNGLDRLLL